MSPSLNNVSFVVIVDVGFSFAKALLADLHHRTKIKIIE